jgi:hypothetical protein
MERERLITVTPTKLGIIYILPSFGSRKRVTDRLGNLPEQLAASFDGNLAILHFDKHNQKGPQNKPANNDPAILEKIMR